MVVLAWAAAPLHAGEFELSAWAGPGFSIPEVWGSAPVGVSVVTVSEATDVHVTEVRGFGLDTRAALSLGGGLTWYFNERLGIEGRVDAVDTDATLIPGRYRVESPRLPSQEVTLSPSDLKFERLRPLSLNVKVKIDVPGPSRLALSGGMSYLPAFKRSSELAAATTVVVVPYQAPEPPPILGTSVPLFAEGVKGRGRFGANGGLSLHGPFSERLTFVADLRWFFFSKYRLDWQQPGVADTPEEAALQEQAEHGLNRLRFNANFMQLSAGVALRF